jgi:uncharacterized protein YjbI with pentapeptide repeats
VDDQQQPGWRPTRRQLLWAVSIVGVVALLLLIRLGYAYRWTGFGLYKVNGEVQPFKTLWDWLGLLIVPAVLAIGGYLFTRSENQRRDRIAEDQRALDRELADERRQDDLLQAYLDRMAQLLTDKDRPLHGAKPEDNLSAVARAWTLTVLPSLDGLRKRSVVQFLYESGLITKDHVVIDLTGAHLATANLTSANLKGANLSGAYMARAKLDDATLSEADLGDAKLFGANLSLAEPDGANLNATVLMGDERSTPLQRISAIRKYTLGGVGPKNADLSGANLSGANLIDAYVSEEQLDSAESLKGATMPNGRKYEDWLKIKGHREHGETGGSS